MPKPSRSLRTVLLLSTWLAICAPVAAGGGVDMEAMAAAMARMMEAMGFAGSGGSQAGAMSFGGRGALDQAGRWGQSLLEGLAPGPATALEGLWEAAGGGLLIVQGGHYRLYASNGAFVDGSLGVAADRVRLWNRASGFAAELEYALDKGRLALRDQSGQLYLYRQLILPGGD